MNDIPDEATVCQLNKDWECPTLYRVDEGDLIELVEPDFDITKLDAATCWGSCLFMLFRHVENGCFDHVPLSYLRPLTKAAAEMLTIAKNCYVAFWQDYNRSHAHDPHRIRRFPVKFRPSKAT